MRFKTKGVNETLFQIYKAIEGALEAGAKEIVVCDGRATMRKIIVSELYP